MTALHIGLAIYIVFLGASCAYALLSGDAEEKRVAIAFIVAAIATNVASALGTHWHGPNWRVVVVDAIFALYLIQLARRSKRYWPIWAAASQLVGLITHFPAILLTNLRMEIYAATQPLRAFPLLASLAIGTWNTVHGDRTQV